MNLSEQIKKEVDEKVKEYHQKNSIEAIVLNSKYQVLTFSGTADYSFLTPSFTVQLIENRNILIKSIKVFLYAGEEIDELFNDTATEHFTIPVGARINKVEDRFNRAGRLELIINESNQNLFTEDIAGTIFNGVPPDLFVDNIYLHYKSKLQNLQCRTDFQVIDDLDTGALAVNPPFIKVMLEVYLY